MNDELFDSPSVETANTPRKRMRGFKLPNKRTLSIIVVVVVVAVAAFFYKSYFVAAMVNGSFISKSSFIKEMQSRAGQEALDSLIITKLIEGAVKDVEITDEEIAAEVKSTDDSLKEQGSSLQETLGARNMSEKEFKHRVIIQKKLEKLVADKTVVTDEEVAKYIKDNKVATPKGMDKATFMKQVSESIRQNKFNQAVQELIDSLRTKANIRYFVNL